MANTSAPASVPFDIRKAAIAVFGILFVAGLLAGIVARNSADVIPEEIQRHISLSDEGAAGVFLYVTCPPLDHAFRINTDSDAVEPNTAAAYRAALQTQTRLSEVFPLSGSILTGVASLTATGYSLKALSDLSKGSGGAAKTVRNFLILLVAAVSGYGLGYEAAQLFPAGCTFDAVKQFLANGTSVAALEDYVSALGSGWLAECSDNLNHEQRVRAAYQDGRDPPSGIVPYSVGREFNVDTGAESQAIFDSFKQKFSSSEKIDAASLRSTMSATRACFTSRYTQAREQCIDFGMGPDQLAQFSYRGADVPSTLDLSIAQKLSYAISNVFTVETDTLASRDFNVQALYQCQELERALTDPTIVALLGPTQHAQA